MASGSLNVSDWLRQFEERAQAFVRDERPDSLIEFDLTIEEREKLYTEVGQPCPWIAAADCPAAVTVAAVQAAADAEEGDEAFIRHFLTRIERAGERSSWDSEYGPATERFFERHFRHRKKSGPWRYVRTVFMHAGIVVAGIRAYAEMLDRLLVGGIEFTYAEHLAAARRVSSTLIRPFLLTQTGFKFSRTTGQYLRRHRRGELSVADLNGLRGYRSGFWPELLQHLRREVGSRQSKVVPPPHLALDCERSCIVLRYPQEWQARGIYRVGGHPVTYPDQRIAGWRPTRVQIGVKDAVEVDPWWGPGMTSVAVFRASDGAFLGSASPGTEQSWTLRAGSCFVVADQSLAPELENLQALPLGVLEVLPQDDAEPAYDIWQLELLPATAYPTLGLRTIGREALPSIAWADARSRGPFGPGVFAGTLPQIRLAHWTDESRSRYAIRLACDGKEQELDVPAGAAGYALPLRPTSRGRIWVEPRGYASTADALAALDFTLIPTGVNVRAGDGLLTEHQEGRIVAQLPPGWILKPLTLGAVPLDGRTWRTQAGTRVFDAQVVTPGFTLPVSLRLPVVSFEARTGANVVWAEELMREGSVVCDLHGPAHAACDITLRDHQRSVPLVVGLRLGESGTSRVELRAFLDAIEGAGMPLGRIELTFGSHSVQTDVWIGSLRQLQSAVSPWQAVVTLAEELADQVPTIGSAIADLIRLKREALSDVSVAPLLKLIPQIGRSETPDGLAIAIADCLYLAAAFDQAEHDCPEHILPSDDAKSLVWFRDGDSTVAPDALEHLVVGRWREALERIRDERNDERDARELLAEWRAALLPGHPSRLADRPGGYHLTDAARRYCQACGLGPGKLRNQALTSVLIPLQQSLDRSQRGTTVHTVANILRQLTLLASGRDLESERISLIERPAVLLPAVNELRVQAKLPPLAVAPGGLDLSDLLPVNCSQLA